MDYFVSIEDNLYSHWQLELLIESFKSQELLSSLVFGMAVDGEPKQSHYLLNHALVERRFSHENLGKRRGYKPLNKAYATYYALEQGILKQPFTLLEPDMVLVRPTVPDGHIACQVDPFYGQEYFKYHGIDLEPHIEELSKDRTFDPSLLAWIPLGAVFVFNDMPLEFFSRVISWIEWLEFERKKKNDVSFRDTAKAGWAMAILERYGANEIKPRFDLEMNLLDHEISHHFAHYRHGLPGVFHKKMYRFEPNGFALGDPFDTLLQHNPTTTTHFLQQIVRNYLDFTKSFS